MIKDRLNNLSKGIIIVVLVSLFMFYCRTLWLFDYINVSFQTETTKDSVFEIYYTTQPNASFNEDESVKQKVSSGSNTVSFKLPIDNIVRFRIDFDEHSDHITLSNIKIEGDRTVYLNEEGDFSFNGDVGQYTYQNGSFVLSSMGQDPYMIHEADLNIKRQCRVNWFIFSFISFFSFFFFLAFLNYLLKFKSKSHSYGDIVFISVFFLLLFIPMLKISDAKKSLQENRLLAQHPSFYVDDNVNFNYGREFDTWFNDRFWGRSVLLKIYAYMRNMNNFIIEKSASKLKDDWYYGSGEMTSVVLPIELKMAYKEQIKYLQQFCRENNIKCYMEIVPSRIFFTSEGLINNKLKRYNDTVYKFTEYVYGNLGFQIVYPYNELLEAKKNDYVFFKTDHHWTDWGAYIGYQAIMKQIKKDFPDIYEAREDDFTISYNNKVRAEAAREYWEGRSCELLNQKDNCILKTEYKYYDMKRDDINVEWIQGHDTKYFDNPLGRYKAVIIGDSYAENFVTFLPLSFQQTTKLRFNNMYEDSLRLNRWKDEILQFKPDVLIILLQEVYINRLGTIKD